MNKKSFFIFIYFILKAGISSSQTFYINQPRLEIDGNYLLIFYDIITKNKADQFFVWVEVKKANREKIITKAFSGDIGSNLKAGKNKKIIWMPEQDSIFIDEEISIEVKAEKYIKSFNKGSMLLRSAVFPGWGQTTISNDKPWLFAGVAVYGTLTGGIIYNQKYQQSLDAYKAEEDPIRRDELLDQTQKQLNISTAMLYSAASSWAFNVLWVAFTPNRYKPLQHANLSFNTTPFANSRGLLLSLRMEF